MEADPESERLARVVAAAAREALDADRPALLGEPLARALRDQSRDGTVLDLLQLFGSVRLQLADAKAEQRLVRAVFDREVLTELLREVTRAGTDPGHQRRVARCAGPLDAILSELDEDAFQIVLNAATNVSSVEMRRVLFRYLDAHREGHEAALGRALADADVAKARVIMDVLAKANTREARRALKEAERNPSAEVRVEAIMRRARGGTDGLRDELVALAEDDESAVRRAALTTIARHRVKDAGPALVQRIRGAAFHKLDVAEKRLALDTLRELSESRAVDLAIELCARKSVLRREAVDDTRIAAIEFLGEHGSGVSVEKALSAASSVWSNTEDVREAAEEALGHVRQRSGGMS